MDERQQEQLNKLRMDGRASAIIDGEEYRQDGYTNLFTKYGTAQDSSTHYKYQHEPITDDMSLVSLYEGNGLFTKIIDRPAEEAVKHGLDIDFGDEDVAEYVDSRLDELEYEDRFSTAEKWARLYGGSIIVVLTNDGALLEEPFRLQDMKSVEELRVFERAVVEPDYATLYNFNFTNSIQRGVPFGQPEYYTVFSLYGYFRVHYSRCLVFRNGKVPENTTNAIYRYWGIPEYVRIRKALQECVVTHENGPKLLERSVQAIYKMKNLANMLATADGEDKVVQRLQVIDLARGLLNSIAIDSEGEDYHFENFSTSGVKDIIDATCNMLSAVTDIPQTILFGRSPAGENSTGKADFENFYNMVENIQKQNMKANTRRLLDMILRQGVIEGQIDKEPRYKIEFAPLWSMTEQEKAGVEAQQASTAKTKADTYKAYMDMQVLDPSEVRNMLADDPDFDIDPVDTGDDGFDLTPELMDLANAIQLQEEPQTAEIGSNGDEGPAEGPKVNTRYVTSEEYEVAEAIDLETDDQEDGADPEAAAVIFVNDEGKILCGVRDDTGEICGPGGHYEPEDGDTEETAIREAIEEFSVYPHTLIPLGVQEPENEDYKASAIYLCDDFSGTGIADGNEMHDAKWLTLDELQNKQLFEPFRKGLTMMLDVLSGNDTRSDFNPAHDKLGLFAPKMGAHGKGGGGGSGRQSESGQTEKTTIKKEKNEVPKTLEQHEEHQKKWIDEKFSDLNDSQKQFLQKRLQYMFDNGQYHMAIEPESMMSVLHDGYFKNQFEAGKSKGAFAPEARKLASEKMFGINSADLTAHDFEKYGYLGSSDFAKDTPYDYGRVVVRFKKDALDGRVTYTSDDSYGDAISDISIAGSDGSNVSIAGLKTWGGHKKEALNYFMLASDEDLKNPCSSAQQMNHRYWELQYHGDIKIAHIDSVYIGEYDSIKDASLIEELQNHGITIVVPDGKGGTHAL